MPLYIILNMDQVFQISKTFTVFFFNNPIIFHNILFLLNRWQDWFHWLAPRWTVAKLFVFSSADPWQSGSLFSCRLATLQLKLLCPASIASLLMRFLLRFKILNSVLTWNIHVEFSADRYLLDIRNLTSKSTFLIQPTAC